MATRSTLLAVRPVVALAVRVVAGAMHVVWAAPRSRRGVLLRMTQCNGSVGYRVSAQLVWGLREVYITLGLNAGTVLTGTWTHV